MAHRSLLTCYGLALALLAFAISPSARSQEFRFEADLDPFVNLPGAYKLTPGSLAEMFPQGDMRANPYFEWLDQAKTRAIFKRHPAGNVEVDLTLMKGEVPVQEMIVDFKNGTFLGITISIFNRGDAGKLDKEDFDKQFMLVGRHLGEQLATKPRGRQGKIERGILTSGFTWISARGMAVLEYNPGVRSANKKIEFLRMRLCRRDAKGAYAAAMQDRVGASVRTSQLPSFVKKESNGNIYVSQIPMVDQGGKGYCVVASIQRLFEYYGVPCDMHQLAQITGADPNRGTSAFYTNKALTQIDHLFKMRYDCIGILGERGGLRELIDEEKGYVGEAVEGRDFKKAIQKYTDSGIPLLWCLNLNPASYPEDPPLSEQTRGGHMRLIIGYNDKTDHILFSDSWGAGHEVKSMAMNHAYSATTGLFMMKPVTN